MIFVGRLLPKVGSLVADIGTRQPLGFTLIAVAIVLIP